MPVSDSVLVHYPLRQRRRIPLSDSQYQHLRTLHHPSKISSKSKCHLLLNSGFLRLSGRAANLQQSHSRHNSRHTTPISHPIPTPNSKFLRIFPKTSKISIFLPLPLKPKLSQQSDPPETFSTKPPRREHKVEKFTSALAWVFLLPVKDTCIVWTYWTALY